MRTFLKLGGKIVPIDEIVNININEKVRGESKAFIHVNGRYHKFSDQDVTILRDFFSPEGCDYAILRRPGFGDIIDLTPIEPAPQFAAEEPAQPAPDCRRPKDHDVESIASMIRDTLSNAGLANVEIVVGSPLRRA